MLRKGDRTGQSMTPLLAHLTATFQWDSHGGTHATGKEPRAAP